MMEEAVVSVHMQVPNRRVGSDQAAAAAAANAEAESACSNIDFVVSEGTKPP